MTGPLSNLRVIDLSHGPAGGMATMVLADFGADVIKVEPPGGDPFRCLANAPMWLRGKRSVVLDLPADAARLQDLVAGADVMVASYAPGEAAPLGADPVTLMRWNPALVYCSITGWGPEGPYARYPADEGLVAAKTGRMAAFRGLTRREGPAFSAVPVATHACTQAAIQGILAALLARERLGRGQLVEASLLQGLLPFETAGLFRQQFPPAAGTPGADFADDPYRLPTLNYHPVMTKDGRWIQFGNLLEHLFYAFADAAGLTEEIIAAGHFGQPATWPAEAREALRDRILLRMRERSADEWMAIFRDNGNVAAEPYASTRDALTNVELTANGDIVETAHPRLGRMRQLGLLARLEATPGHIGGPEPLVGEHTASDLAEPPRAAWRPSATPAATAPTPPLADVTVLEFATIIAAPLGASLLADLGARVIKVEPLGGDPGRPIGGGPGGGYGSLRWNAGKESVCLDLKSAAGQEVVGRLLSTADIVIHNYRPGVPERLGIGYERARERNPRVVYLSANGYGPDAPGALRPCAHPIPGAAVGGALYQAGAGVPPAEVAGLEELREVARRLMRANEMNPDPNTSLVIASSALLGLYAARRLGVGQRVFVNMMAANAYANHDDAIDYDGRAPRPVVDCDVYGRGALYRLYPARTGWVFLAVTRDDAWQALCRATGRADLAADPRFVTEQARASHDAELVAELAALFAGRNAGEWEDLLIQVGVGCVSADGAMPGVFWAASPQVQANGFVVEAEHPELGVYRRHGAVVKLSGTPARCGPGSRAGDSTHRILAELGYDKAAITELRDHGVIAGL